MSNTMSNTMSNMVAKRIIVRRIVYMYVTGCNSLSQNIAHLITHTYSLVTKTHTGKKFYKYDAQSKWYQKKAYNLYVVYI